MIQRIIIRMAMEFIRQSVFIIIGQCMISLRKIMMLLNVTSCLLQLNRRYSGSGGMLNFKVHFEGSLEVQTIAFIL